MSVAAEHLNNNLQANSQHIWGTYPLAYPSRMDACSAPEGACRSTARPCRPLCRRPSRRSHSAARPRTAALRHATACASTHVEHHQRLVLCIRMLEA
eukprot:5463258-Pleurochrysis_carterae.AAC.2